MHRSIVLLGVVALLRSLGDDVAELLHLHLGSIASSLHSELVDFVQNIELHLLFLLFVFFGLLLLVEAVDHQNCLHDDGADAHDEAQDQALLLV